MRYFGNILLVSLVVLTVSDAHMHAHGPLGTFHLNVEAPSPTGCNRPSGVSSTAVTLATLNVTATVYNSSQIIDITWTPFGDECTDDFIGAFFTEIPLERGRIQRIDS